MMYLSLSMSKKLEDRVAEIIITKRVTEKKKVDIDISTEEVTLEHPDGRSERLS